MPTRALGLKEPIPAPLVDGLAAIRSELEVPADFSSEVAAAAAAAQPDLPALDLTEMPFETVDPAGAKDLDQALFLERSDTGFLVHYAIADPGAFITPGDPVDVEAQRRGVTLYAPDQRTPLHPAALSEDAASLLPDQTRPAYVWQVRLQADGSIAQAQVRRALVRSRAQHTYEGVQAQIDAKSGASESLALLAEIGPLRQKLEAERGGISLQIPEQEVRSDGTWSLAHRQPLPVEGWNAQISLLTGMAAAEMMLQAKVGILRVLPAATEGAIRRLRHIAKALGLEWPDDWDYARFVASLDPTRPTGIAMINACTSGFRGAEYVAFNGENPPEPGHAALATNYAHVTAPLRRLVDRYTLAVCAALSAGEAVPEWVTSQLTAVAEAMEKAEDRANSYERSIIDLVESYQLSDQVGQRFPGVIVDIDYKENKPATSGDFVPSAVAVEARIVGENLVLGSEIEATLQTADPATRTVTFSST